MSVNRPIVIRKMTSLARSQPKELSRKKRFVLNWILSDISDSRRLLYSAPLKLPSDGPIMADILVHDICVSDRNLCRYQLERSGGMRGNEGPICSANLWTGSIKAQIHQSSINAQI